MAHREENRKAIEGRIYQTALRLFCDIGYRKTTLVDIAAAANVSTRTLYRYFPKKESILRRFCQENIVELKRFASEMDKNTPLFNRIINIMLEDYSNMFGIFDPGYVLHYTRDADGILNRFEIENILEMESIYCTVLKWEQVAHGLEPNANIQRCASIIAAIYRHCNDIFRFRNAGVSDLEQLRRFYESHLGAVWESLYKTLLSDGAKPLGQDIFNSLYAMPD